jgi:hypothetical protein
MFTLYEASKSKEHGKSENPAPLGDIIRKDTFSVQQYTMSHNS